MVERRSGWNSEVGARFTLSPPPSPSPPGGGHAIQRPTTHRGVLVPKQAADGCRPRCTVPSRRPLVIAARRSGRLRGDPRRSCRSPTDRALCEAGLRGSMASRFRASAPTPTGRLVEPVSPFGTSRRPWRSIVSRSAVTSPQRSPGRGHGRRAARTGRGGSVRGGKGAGREGDGEAAARTGLPGDRFTSVPCCLK